MLVVLGCYTPLEPPPRPDPDGDVVIDADAAVDGAADPCHDAPDETPCSRGVCRSGECCQGCWDGADCLPGTDEPLACGRAGALCTPCLGVCSCDLQRCYDADYYQAPVCADGICGVGPTWTCCGPAGDMMCSTTESCIPSGCRL